MGGTVGGTPVGAAGIVTVMAVIVLATSAVPGPATVSARLDPVTAAPAPRSVQVTSAGIVPAALAGGATAAVVTEAAAIATDSMS